MSFISLTSVQLIQEPLVFSGETVSTTRGKKRQSNVAISKTPVKQKIKYSFTMLKEAEDKSFLCLSYAEKIMRVGESLLQKICKLPNADDYKEKLECLLTKTRSTRNKHTRISAKNRIFKTIESNLVKLHFNVYVDALFIED